MRAAVSGVSKYQSTGAGADESLGRRFRRNSLSRAAAADRDGIAQDEPLVFIPRQVPLTPATRGGFAVFMVFLVTFTIIVRMERNDDVFFFAEHARQLVGVDDFRRLGQDRHSYREYQQWFEYHFLDGMANASTTGRANSYKYCVGRRHCSLQVCCKTKPTSFDVFSN